VSIRLLCGERDSILYLQVAARQRHIAESGKTFHGHVYCGKVVAVEQAVNFSKCRLEP